MNDYLSTLKPSVSSHSVKDKWQDQYQSFSQAAFWQKVLLPDGKFARNYLIERIYYFNNLANYSPENQASKRNWTSFWLICPIIEVANRLLTIKWTYLFLGPEVKFPPRRNKYTSINVDLVQNHRWPQMPPREVKTLQKQFTTYVKMYIFHAEYLWSRSINYFYRLRNQFPGRYNAIINVGHTSWHVHTKQ